MVTVLGHDAVLLDLDGVVYSGDHAVPGAPEALRRLRGDGTPLRFVTNNASRTPEQVAQTLCAVGVDADPAEVLGSAVAAVGLLVSSVGLQPGAVVGVVGGHGLLDAVTVAGLHAVSVTDLTAAPAAVVQGFSPDLGWRDLAAASRWVRQGVPWVATNLDRTIPTSDGTAPGNGMLVACVREAVGRDPDLVAGKPAPHLFLAAASSCGARHPLVVGDRLDTDIAGGRAAGFTTALVLTGVHGLLDALDAEPALRPDRVLLTLGDLWEGPGADRAAAATEQLQHAWRDLDSISADLPEGTGADGAGHLRVREDWARRLSPAAG